MSETEAYAKVLYEVDIGLERISDDGVEFVVGDSKSTLWHAYANEAPSEMGADEFESFLDADVSIVSLDQLHEFEGVL